MKVQSITNEQSFNILLNELTRYKLGAVFVLSGEEHIYKRKFISALENVVFPKGEGKDWNLSVYQGKEEALEEESVSDACATSVFGSGMRMVVVLNYTDRKNVDDIFDVVERASSSVVLVLTTEKELQKDPVYKEYSNSYEHVYHIDFPKAKASDIRSWVSMSFKKRNKTITREALEYFLENMADDFDSIRSEIPKVLDYHADKDMIDIDEIKDFTHITKADLGFAFCNEVMKKNGKKAFEMLRRMKKPIRDLHGLLIYNFTNLYYLKMFPKGVSDKDIAAVTKAKPWALNKLRAFLSNYSKEELAYIVNKLYDISVILVSRPEHIQLAAFEAFIFDITLRKE